MHAFRSGLVPANKMSNRPGWYNSEPIAGCTVRCTSTGTVLVHLCSWKFQVPSKAICQVHFKAISFGGYISVLLVLGPTLKIFNLSFYGHFPLAKQCS